VLVKAGTLFYLELIMNVVKLLKRMNEQSDPPCKTCPYFEHCEETEQCCDLFVNYVEFGVTCDIGWFDNDPRKPYLFTCVPKRGISIKEISKACDMTTTKVQTMLSFCKKYKLAFETTGFYMTKDIENEIKNISSRSVKLRNAKITLCKILLEKDEQVNPKRTSNLVKEVRRNVQYVAKGVC
jgi:hypothetical protein